MIHIVDLCAKKIIKIRKTDKVLYELIKRKLVIFESDENHPSLRKHKLHGGLEGYWSISINMSIRMVYFIKNDEVWFINIGTHDEVYRMN